MRGIGFKGVRLGGRTDATSSPTIDADAQLYFDAVGDVPEIIKPAINALFVGLKDLGYFQDPNFWMIINTPTLNWQNSLIEIKSLVTNSTFASQTTSQFTTKGAYPSVQKGFLASGWLSLDFTPSINMVQNDTTEVFVTYEDEVNAGTFNYGSRNTNSQATLFSTNFSNQVQHASYAYAPNAGLTQGANSGNAGVYISTRKPDLSSYIALNGSIVATNVNSGGSLTTRNIYINGFKNNTASAPASIRNQSSSIVWGAFNSVPDVDVPALSTIFETYQNTTQQKQGLQTKGIVFDGNSHMVYQASATARKLAYDLIMQGYEHTNCGVPSQGTLAMIADYASEIAPKFNATYTDNILVVEEMTNDYFFGSTKEQTLQNIKDYCLLAQSTGFTVILVPLFCRNYAGNTNAVGRTQFNLDQDWLMTEIQTDYATFCDYILPPHPTCFLARADYASDGDYDTAIATLLSVPAGQFIDGVHLTESNYYTIAEQLKTVIDTI